MKASRHNLLSVLAIAAYTFILLEAGLRLSGLDYRALGPLLYYMAEDAPVHEISPNPEKLYGLKPGSHAVFAGGREVSINSLGLRGKERQPEKAPGTTRIIMAGCSNLYGAEVTDGDTLPDYLEQVLNENFEGKFEVWNAGISGHTLRQETASARELLAYKPDLMIVQYGHEGRRAFLLGADYRHFFKANPELYRENLKFFPGAGTRAGLWLASRSAVCRTALALLSARWSPLKMNPYYENEESNRDAFASFARENGGKVPLLLMPLLTLQPFPAPNTGVLDLGAYAPRNAPRGYYAVHPSADVYRHQAYIAAKQLSEIYPALFMPHGAFAVPDYPVAAKHPAVSRPSPRDGIGPWRVRN
ncbi:MAG: SGNH/GDSL hydrolase family protein [Elusimicrobia bacterium]|nr:SGNH/GDSL hydrolase family protein [Elusimicrobiota bacterium]